jgi:hypothetical protein
MQRPEYFAAAHSRLWQRRRLRAVSVKCHDIDTSRIEGAVSRGDRRMGRAIELVWRRGARLDSWQEQMNAGRWWRAIADAGIDIEQLLHQPYQLSDHLPWDHLRVKYGRHYLEKEQTRALHQLDSIADCDPP